MSSVVGSRLLTRAPLPAVASASTSAAAPVLRPTTVAARRPRFETLSISPVFGAKPTRTPQRRHPPLNPRSSSRNRQQPIIDISPPSSSSSAVVDEVEAEIEAALAETDAMLARSALSEASTSSSSSSTWTSSLIYPSTEVIVVKVNEIVAPLTLPDDLAVRICTHKSVSQQHGGNHNEKLSFLGRRSLEFQLSQFWFANRHHLKAYEPSLSFSSLDEYLKFDGSLSAVGRDLDLTSAMRWKAMRDADGNQTGLEKTRRMAVQALCGALTHQYGLAESTRFFESRILPHLLLPDSFREIAAAQAAARASG